MPHTSNRVEAAEGKALGIGSSEPIGHSGPNIPRHKA